MADGVEYQLPKRLLLEENPTVPNVKVDVLLHGYNFRSDVGIIGFCSIVLVTGQKRTLVDVGHVGRRIYLEPALKELGLTIQDIDNVVMSHDHWDHNQNFDLFEHCPLITHPWERKYASKPHKNDWATPKWTGAMIEQHPNIVEVQDGYEIEPGVTVMHTPGHSPGSITVLAETERGKCAMTGDVLHYASVALSKKNPLVFWDDGDATRSIERILQTADVIYPGHDQPFRMVAGDKVEYVEPFKMALGGVQKDQPGLTYDAPARPPWIMPGIEETQKFIRG